MIFVCFMLILQQQQHSTIKCTQITLSPQQQTHSVNNTTSLVACFYICNKSKGIEVTKIVKVINPDHWHQFIKGSLPKGRVKIILHYWFNQEQYCSMIKDILVDLAEFQIQELWILFLLCNWVTFAIENLDQMSESEAGGVACVLCCLLYYYYCSIPIHSAPVSHTVSICSRIPQMKINETFSVPTLQRCYGQLADWSEKETGKF